MLTESLSERSWVIKEGPFILKYEMTNSVNPAFEDFELWEFGIHCTLYDETHTLISESEVLHISPDESFVVSLVDTMIKHKVFPAHLLDVIYDELSKSLEYTC